MEAAIVIAYLVLGAAIGLGFIFLIEFGCPSNGEVLKAAFFGALIGVPVVLLTVVLSPIWGAVMLCDNISETRQWASFKRWCARPVCAKAKALRRSPSGKET